MKTLGKEFITNVTLMILVLHLTNLVGSVFIEVESSTVVECKVLHSMVVPFLPSGATISDVG